MREGEVRHRVGPVTGQDVLKGQKSLALTPENKGQVVTVHVRRVEVHLHSVQPRY